MKKYIALALVLTTTIYSGIGPFPGGSGGSSISTPVSIPNGGTGQTTAQAAIDALLPSQASANGKFLTSNGSASSWGTVSASPGGSDTEIQFNNSGSFGGDSQLTFNSTTGKITMAPSGAATYGISMDNSSSTGNWRGVNVTGTLPSGGVQNGLRSVLTQGATASASYPWGVYSEINGSAIASGTSQYVGFYAKVDAQNSQKTAAGVLDGYGNHGAFLDCRNTNSTGNAIGVVAAGRQSNQNIGGHFYASDASGSSPQNYGVHAITTTDSAAAQAVAVYGKVGATAGAALERSLSTTGSAAFFDNGDTTLPALSLADNGTVVFQVKDGGNIVGKALAFTPTAVELTADNQSVTVTNSGQIRLTSDNSTATNRTFVLGDGGDDGQMLILEWNEDNTTGAGELLDSGNANLSADWVPNIGDTIQLTWNNAASEWRELGRSNN